MRGLDIHVNLPQLLLLFETQETLDHMVGFPSRRETISRLGIEPPTTPFGLGTSPLSSGSLGSYRTKYSPLQIVEFQSDYV